jgi:hypothetical protein
MRGRKFRQYSQVQMPGTALQRRVFDMLCPYKDTDTDWARSTVVGCAGV